jgi:hypothetical protein
MRIYDHIWYYLAEFFLEWEVFQEKKGCWENKNTHFMFNNPPPRKSCRLWGNVKEYGRAGQATDGNMAKAHCMLDNYRYRLTLRICNMYCFSTATVVARPRLNVTLRVRCFVLKHDFRKLYAEQQQHHPLSDVPGLCSWILFIYICQGSWGGGSPRHIASTRQEN